MIIRTCDFCGTKLRQGSSDGVVKIEKWARNKKDKDTYYTDDKDYCKDCLDELIEIYLGWVRKKKEEKNG